MDARTLYHTVRRAGTRHVVRPGDPTRHYVYRYNTISDLRRVKVPRGMGATRDAIARHLADARSVDNTPRTLQQRLDDRVVARYTRVIRLRGGETEIEEQSRSVGLRLLHRAQGLVLLGCDGWRQYSRAFGARPASLRYLCGIDDNGHWAVRVPATCTDVDGALQFVTPAEVQRAEAAGRRVLRQGDVYLVEQARDNLDALAGTSHRWDAATRTLHHDDHDAPHGALRVPFRCKAVVQSVLRMGRRVGRRRGD